MSILAFLFGSRTLQMFSELSSLKLSELRSCLVLKERFLPRWSHLALAVDALAVVLRVRVGVRVRAQACVCVGVRHPMLKGMGARGIKCILRCTPQIGSMPQLSTSCGACPGST